jgi:malonyl CoA-acyl carrier protein transacylase
LWKNFVELIILVLRMILQGVVMAFLDKMKEYLDKGVEVSKEALSKAGEAVQDFSDKSVTKIESHQLVSRQNKEYRLLGQAVEKFFAENPGASLSADHSVISGILEEIKRLEKEIAQREEILKAQEHHSEEASADDSHTTTAHTEGTATDAEFTKS